MRYVASNPGRSSWSSVVMLASALAWSGCGGGVAPVPDGGGHDGSGIDSGMHGEGGTGDGSVDGGGTDTGPRPDLGSMCGNGVVEGTEQCDDMNDVDTDACKNDCTNQCGDGTVSSAAGETCDTGIATGTGSCPTGCDDSMVCTMDLFSGSACTSACAHVALTAGPADGCCPTGASMATDPDCAAGCGNGVVDSGETCDTGITSGTGACPTSCDDSIACTTDAATGTACTAACTHAPITTPSGTTVDGCCPTGATHTTDTDCPVSCGNGTLDTGETCDTAITTGAGMCPTMASCNDSMACTTDALISGGTCMAACSHTPITAPSGTTVDGCCPTGANMTTDTDCAAVCGNSIVEAGETCDPPNGTTCDTTCHTGTVSTGFRVTTGRVISPRVIQNVSGCTDLTDMGVTVFFMRVDSLNTNLMNSINSYGLNVVQVFRPLDTVSATTPSEVYVNASCSGATTPATCMPAAAMSMSAVTTANNMATGMCYTPVAADVNGRCAGAGTCMGTYAPTVNTISGPCYATNEADMSVSFTVSGSTIVVPLHHARVSATYTGSPTSRLTPGVMVGFLNAVDAADIVITLPVLGTRRLYNFLQAGGARQADSTGAMQTSSCNVGGMGVEDDRDTVGGVVGFWFFLNVDLDRITWSGP